MVMTAMIQKLINPVAEIYDLIDNNCDGQINEGLDATYYIDAVPDGYG